MSRQQFGWSREGQGFYAGVALVIATLELAEPWRWIAAINARIA